MSSNEPFKAIPDDARNTLNLAIKNQNAGLLQTVIAREGIEQNLHESFLHNAWQQYQKAPARSFDGDQTQVLKILFQHSHYPEHQRTVWIQRMIEYALTINDLFFIKAILPCLNPIEDILPLITYLIQNRFEDLCSKSHILPQLLRSLPDDQQHAPCRQFMQKIQQGSEIRHRPISTRALLRCAQEIDPLLKALAYLFYSIPDPDLASLTDDWQTVFTKLAAKEQGSLPQFISMDSDVLVTGKNIASLLTIYEESQRLELLQTLFHQARICFQELAQNEEHLQQVLMLLPKSQRVQLFLFKSTGRKSMSDFIADALWPVINPLLEPSDLTTIRNQRLRAHQDDCITRLTMIHSDEEIWQDWKHLPEKSLSILLDEAASATHLINQLPTDMQRSIRDQLLSHVHQHGKKLISLTNWLGNESHCSALFPFTSQWLKEAVAIRELPWGERLPQLATEPTGLHALLDHLPSAEHHTLLSWLLNWNTKDETSLNTLLDRYIGSSRLPLILSRDRTDWNQNMPLVLAILERLPESERESFIKQLPHCKYIWQPENYQMVRRACTLFNLPPETFLKRIRMLNIPLTPLMQAARNNDRKMAKEHIQLLNEQDWLGRTALMHACLTKHQDMIEFLAAQDGCDFSMKTLHDETVFSCAVQTKNPYLLRSLLKISSCKPTPEDAMTALCCSWNHIKWTEFLFETFFPEVEWQQTKPLLENSSAYAAQFRVASAAVLHKYYDQATLPIVARNTQLSKLELTFHPFAVFRYQMQVLGIDASKAMNLDYLLKALTGRVSEALCFVDFHIGASEVPCLVDFVKNNPHLKQLSLGTLHWYPEDEQIFIDQLKPLQGGRVELAIHGRGRTYLALSKPTVRGGFFESPVQDVEEQASCSLRM